MAIDLFTFIFHNHTTETIENANSIVRTEIQLVILLIFLNCFLVMPPYVLHLSTLYGINLTGNK